LSGGWAAGGIVLLELRGGCDVREGTPRVYGDMVFLFSYIFSRPHAGQVWFYYFSYFFGDGGRGVIDGEEGTSRRRCRHRCRNVRGLFNLQQLSRERERPETPNRCFCRPRPFPPIMEYLCFKDLSDPDQPISIESDPVFGN